MIIILFIVIVMITRVMIFNIIFLLLRYHIISKAEKFIIIISTCNSYF